MSPGNSQKIATFKNVALLTGLTALFGIPAFMLFFLALAAAYTNEQQAWHSGLEKPNGIIAILVPLVIISFLTAILISLSGRRVTGVSLRVLAPMAHIAIAFYAFVVLTGGFSFLPGQVHVVIANPLVYFPLMYFSSLYIIEKSKI